MVGQVFLEITPPLEHHKHLKAGLHEYNPENIGHANSDKHKTFKTQVGKITFTMPQGPEGGFYPEEFDQGLRSERTLTITLVEMYVKGVSTRKVAAIVE